MACELLNRLRRHSAHREVRTERVTEAMNAGHQNPFLRERHSSSVNSISIEEIYLL
jgi:hypothetical protein